MEGLGWENERSIKNHIMKGRTLSGCRFLLFWAMRIPIVLTDGGQV
jgi:hypothetical protein